MGKRKYLIAGNWKMNGTLKSLREVIEVDKFFKLPGIDIILCLPNTIIHPAVEKTVSTNLKIGAQNCHHHQEGAFTGDISARMLKDIGAKMVIVGHSERRQAYGETNQLVKAKASAVIDAGLSTIICVGETEKQKNNGQTKEVVCEQVKNSMPETSNAKNTVIAYEPIWAIGTGKVPSLEDIKKIHGSIRTLLGDIKGENASQQMRVLYGGSVKPGNAKEIFSLEDVDGALVGGASLKAADFIEIAKYAQP